MIGWAGMGAGYQDCPVFFNHSASFVCILFMETNQEAHHNNETLSILGNKTALIVTPTHLVLLPVLGSGLGRRREAVTRPQRFAVAPLKTTFGLKPITLRISG